MLSQVFWYNSTISLSLDTISVFLSEYSNTTITSSSTIYGNISSLSASISSQVQLAQSDSPQFIGGGYQGFGLYRLANGTDGEVPDGVTSFAYPTPYLAITGFTIITNLPSAGCPLDSSTILSQVPFSIMAQMAVPEGLGMLTVHLKSTFYSPLPLSATSGGFGFFNLDTESFSAFLASNTSLISEMPYLASCSYMATGIGPPALQIPATALTTTVRTTVKENRPYTTKGLAPGSPIKTSIPPQTTPLPQGSNEGSPDQIYPASSTQSPPAELAPSQGSSDQGSQFPNLNPDKDSPNQSTSNVGTAESPNPQDGDSPAQGGGSNDPIDQGSGTANSIPGSGNQDTPDQASNKPQIASTAKAVAAPALSYAGTTIQPNAASQYNLPGIGTVSPDGPAVTTDGIVYSLAPSATAMISNGVTIPINPVVDVLAASPQPGVFSFQGTPYTADASSRFVIAGQTVAPAGPAITVSGTPIKIAPGATAAVIGTQTVPIVYSPAVHTPTIAPVFTFAGSTYTASSSSAFVIEGHTLRPGAGIEVQGTKISYPAGGTEILVGTSTQSLSFATSEPSATAPAFAFDGSRYTADSSSRFVIDGQTLAPGSVITVSGTPISYDAGASAVVIGTSREALSYAKITPSAAIVTFDGSTFTADASSDFVINGQTLTPNGIITISGTPISYAAAASAVVIGTSTEPLSYATATPSAAVITFDGSTYTADSSSDFVIKGQTLAPGDVITVSGTPISYASGGTDVVIGTSTEAVGIGGLIISGFGGGGGGGGAANTGVATFTDGAVGGSKCSGVMLGAAVAVSSYWALL